MRDSIPEARHIGERYILIIFRGQREELYSALSNMLQLHAAGIESLLIVIKRS